MGERKHVYFANEETSLYNYACERPEGYSNYIKRLIREDMTKVDEFEARVIAIVRKHFTELKEKESLNPSGDLDENDLKQMMNDFNLGD